MDIIFKIVLHINDLKNSNKTKLIKQLYYDVTTVGWRQGGDDVVPGVRVLRDAVQAEGADIREVRGIFRI